ncbi:hypothetical protein GCM10010230_65590 [Streptomyces narbonensis]|nr:hypothetical protein GCM10010230_65590 [Streptomyces narbonensis]
MGHQSRFVLGRVDVGVGAGITGFSLSLPGTSVLLSVSVFPSAVGGDRIGVRMVAHLDRAGRGTRRALTHNEAEFRGRTRGGPKGRVIFWSS